MRQDRLLQFSGENQHFLWKLAQETNGLWNFQTDAFLKHNLYFQFVVVAIHRNLKKCNEKLVIALEYTLTLDRI